MVATRFYPGAQKTFRSSWQAFRLRLRASLASANRSAFTLSQSLTTPFADPFVGLDGRNLRDGVSYTENIFWGQFFCVFYFPENNFVLLAGMNSCHFSKKICDLAKLFGAKIFTDRVFYLRRLRIALRIADWTSSASSSVLYG